MFLLLQRERHSRMESKNWESHFQSHFWARQHVRPFETKKLQWGRSADILHMLQYEIPSLLCIHQELQNPCLQRVFELRRRTASKPATCLKLPLRWRDLATNHVWCARMLHSPTRHPLHLSTPTSYPLEPQRWLNHSQHDQSWGSFYCQWLLQVLENWKMGQRNVAWPQTRLLYLLDWLINLFLRIQHCLKSSG